MAPPPNVLVIMNDGGKEIGGGNHYCTICRVPPPRTPPRMSHPFPLSPYRPIGSYILSLYFQLESFASSSFYLSVPS